jgi:hypothetical protein
MMVSLLLVSDVVLNLPVGHHQSLKYKGRGHSGRDRMVIEFTTTCAISAYHH